jgi:hypothetical protein
MNLKSERVVVLGLVIFSFFLRVYRLDHHPLHADEAFAVLFSARRLGEMLSLLGSVEPHPPLYYSLLHFWLSLLGDDEFVVRFISVIAGTLIVPLVYDLGRALFGVKVGQLASFLAAINPFLIWHSQETRMYSLLACFGLWSISLFIKMQEERGWIVFGFHAFLTLLALYTHYFALLLLAVESSMFLLSPNRRSFLKNFFLSQAVILICFLPWAFYVTEFMLEHVKTWIQPIGLLPFLRRCAVAYSLGTTFDERFAPFVLFGFLLIFLAGLFSKKKPIALYSYLFVPLVLVFLFSLRRPMFDERYLIFVVPAYLLLLAIGLEVMSSRRFLAWFSLLFIVLSSTYSLHNYYHVPLYAKALPWPSLCEYLDEHKMAGDIVVQNYPDPAFAHYFDERLPRTVLPERAPLDKEETADKLKEIIASYDRVWLLPVLSPFWDAEGFVERWLEKYCDEVWEGKVGSIRLNLYLTPRRFLAEMKPVNASLGGKAKLLGYRLEAKAKMKPGEKFRLTLYWQALAKMEKNYTVFAHILDQTGWLRGQKDNPPVGGTYPTTEWVVGEIVVDKYEIEVSPEAPPGEYRIEVGMYELATMKRLPAFSEGGERLPEDRVLLEDVLIVN